MKKNMLFLSLGLLFVGNMFRADCSLPLAQNLLKECVQLDDQAMLTSELFEQKVKEFVEQGGDINEPISVNPFDEDSIAMFSFIDSKKEQSLLSYTPVFGEVGIDLSKVLLKYGANPLQVISIAINEEYSYEGTIFDSLLLVCLLDAVGIVSDISIDIIILLLENFDKEHRMQIIHCAYERICKESGASQEELEDLNVKMQELRNQIV